jgi:choline dehydrogenase-like flavoprotein
VCIVGSGFAGAILAESLVRHGIRTIVLESGFDAGAPPLDPRLKPLEVFRSSGPLDYPVARTRFRGVGGTSWLWGGFCTRLQPADFEENAFTPRDCRWPIRYRDIEPYYERAERSLQVSGGPESKLHPPRRSSYPSTLMTDDSYLRSMFGKVGVAVSPQSLSIPAARVALTHLPAFQASSHGTLIQGGTVTRLITQGNGRLTAAEVKDLDRNVKTVRARVYVVACGGLESPRLLLLSRTAEFPNGIGNNHDVVGRYFMEHSNVGFTATARIRLTRVIRDRAFDISYQYYDDFKKRGLGGMRLDMIIDAVLGTEVRGWQFRSIAGKLWSPELRIGAGVEMEPSSRNRVTLDPDIRDHFGNPAANVYVGDSEADLKTREEARRVVRRLYTSLGAKDVQESPRRSWAHHHIGTCRMGDNPQTSVVDQNLRVHGTSNLFVAGSAVFVTSGCSGPTLTLTALSLRLADHIRTQMNAGVFNGEHAGQQRPSPIASLA